MNESNQKSRDMSRRDALKAIGFTALGGGLATIGLWLKYRFGITFASPVDSTPVVSQPRLGDHIQAAPAASNLDSDRFNNEKLGYPDRWPETAEDAANLFGGKKEYWRRDLYLDKDGETQWGGAWVMDAYALKTDFKPDGQYVDAIGQPLPEGEIYDFNALDGKVDVDFGPYRDTYQAHGTAWDGEMYTAGNGRAVFEQSVQAVMRPIAIECIYGGNVIDQYKDEAKKRTAEEFSRYLFNGTDPDRLKAGLWDEKMQNFKLVSGHGWSNTIAEPTNPDTRGREILLDSQWPETAEDAANLFGGKKEYWRRDLYLDKDGETQWGGAWVMDAYALKTDFKPDGQYVDAIGQPLPEGEIYDFNALDGKVDVDFGPYRDTYQAHGTAWDGKMYTAGNGTAEFRDAVQAVIRPIIIECIEGDDRVAQYRDEAKKRTAEEFSRYLFNGTNPDKFVAGLWNELNGKFKLVKGEGWKLSIVSFVIKTLFGLS